MRKAILAVAMMGIFVPTGSALADSCEFPPQSPSPPLGCKAMRPLCVCDRYGQNCQWQFVCVPS